MTIRTYRWCKRLLLVAAALPLYQTGCALNDFFLQDFSQNLVFGTFSVLVRNATSTLSSFFPSADLLQMLLGANATSPFTG